jgi:hypothetical protein
MQLYMPIDYSSLRSSRRALLKQVWMLAGIDDAKTNAPECEVDSCGMAEYFYVCSSSLTGELI